MPLPAYTSIHLPSRGLLYEGKIPDGKVEIRKMTTSDEAIMAGANGTSNDKITRLIAACVKFPQGVQQSELLVTDRFYLLLALRTTTFGPNYNFGYKCQYCGAQHKEKVDILTDLTEKTAAPDLIEPILCKLTEDGSELGLRLLRCADEDSLTRMAKRAKVSAQQEGQDVGYISRLALHVVTKNGVEFTDALERQEFVKMLTAGDALDIRACLEKAEPGIDLTLNLECGTCNAMNEVDMPFTADFFRPSKR